MGPIDSLSQKRPMTPEDVGRPPLPGMAAANGMAFSPDDRWVTYLLSPERSLVSQLYAYDTQSGKPVVVAAPPEGGTTEENVSREEALRRERIRQVSTGITHYAWAEHANHLITALRGNIYGCEGPGKPLRLIYEGGGLPAIDPQISPDGKWVAFIQDAELYVIPFAGGAPCQVTHGARGTGKTHGLAEYIAMEEMGRRHGFWWSPDSQRIAFTEVDETHIPLYRIMHQGMDETGPAAEEAHRYPFAGQPNARVKLGVVSLVDEAVCWLDLGSDEDIYLARVQWFPDGHLAAQIENRAQTNLSLIVYEIPSGNQKTLIEETNRWWIDLDDMLRPLRTGGFIWGSERTGYRHLYLYDADGELVHPLTQGDWVVDTIAGVDEDRGLVYFTGTLSDPRESHLYAVSFEGGIPRRITTEPGMHTVTLDHACQRFVDSAHSIDHPPRVTLRSLEDGSELGVIDENHDPRLSELSLEGPELVTLHNRTGVPLYGAVFRPPPSFGPGPYPTIIYVYGGPTAQLVVNGWNLTVAMRAQYLRSLGFLVFVLDNRGSARRGMDFVAPIYHDLGHVEVDDQVDGVRWLVEHGLADPARVGIYGWSYGGYMSAMCLARAPETFRAAVAGAPVSHWDGYDTHYTERYMGTPQTNPGGYVASSVMTYVDQIQGKLMLVHGLIDENVHFRHTARLVNALTRAHKPYELMLFPDERHLPRRLADRVYMEERIRDFFTENLLV